MCNQTEQQKNQSHLWWSWSLLCYTITFWTHWPKKDNVMAKNDINNIDLLTIIWLKLQGWIQYLSLDGVPNAKSIFKVHGAHRGRVPLDPLLNFEVFETRVWMLKFPSQFPVRLCKKTESLIWSYGENQHSVIYKWYLFNVMSCFVSINFKAVNTDITVFTCVTTEGMFFFLYFM